MRLSDFDYHLPPECIAQHPAPQRDQSRLMVLRRADQSIVHHRFFELPELLDSNSVLVLNQSRVIPARLRFKLGNGKGEILLIKSVGVDLWECLVRPGEKFQPGLQGAVDSDCSFEVKAITPQGLRLIQFTCDDFKVYLKTHGLTPTPPYIREPLKNPEEYQTIYARRDGSAAAPTAGFHFTEGVFEALKARGIGIEFVTLHVGFGTFQPVKTEDITQHQMHSEWFELSIDVANRLNQAKAQGKRIVAVGTTSVRVLESCSDPFGLLTARSGETNLFIYPGYSFKFVDQMITNFHVPKSSLLMLVSAFAGREFILKAYEFAKKENYRFFSFGDAMLIQ